MIAPHPWRLGGLLFPLSCNLFVVLGGAASARAAEKAALASIEQSEGTVPPGIEYEEAPRGRVNDSGEFFLFADKCILADAKALRKAMTLPHLPGHTKVLTDDHYRCPRCLWKRPARKQEEADWNLYQGAAGSRGGSGVWAVA
jgi:hypothetical protein